MENEPLVQPLPMQHRQRTFWLLLAIFLILLPFLFLYATGYRFEFGGSGSLVSTGGMYIAVERTGAEIFIDDELVRETRTFRRAFYAQSLTPGTHRVHVQKPDNHTWVKELPVYAHLVTEAQAFNVPLVPLVRVISEWESATGTPVVKVFSLVNASTTNGYIATTTKSTTTLTKNSEFVGLLELFKGEATSTTETLVNRLTGQINTFRNATTSATSTTEVATSSIEWQGVKLYEDDGEVYARWVGSRDNMPYYYCAEDFPPYIPVEFSIKEASEDALTEQTALVEDSLETAEFIHPIQTVDENVPCDPVIRVDNRSQKVTNFDFYDGSTDFVVIALEDGIYVVEIDDRAWQNMQPLVRGANLDMRIENGQIYVYDGKLIYQIIQA